MKKFIFLDTKASISLNLIKKNFEFINAREVTELILHKGMWKLIKSFDLSDLGCFQ